MIARSRPLHSPFALLPLLAAAALPLASASCGDDSAVIAPSAQDEAGADATSNGPPDAGQDARPDADAAPGVDATVDAPEAAPDAAQGDAAVAPVVVSPNANSVLSDGLDMALAGVSTVRVTSVGGGDLLPTPYATLDGNGAGHVWVLGLAPSTTYAQVVDPRAPDGGAVPPITVSFTTPALPKELAPLAFVVTPGTGAPQPGYYLVSGAGDDAFAVDQAGTIRWYRAFGAQTQETKMQHDGTLTTYVGNSTGSQPVPGSYVRVTGDGAEIASYAAASPDTTEPGSPAVYTDPHELLVTVDEDGNEHLHMLGYEMRAAPLPDAGATWAFHELLRQRADGTVEFQWKSWSRFDEDDLIELDTPGDFDHSNALAIDPTDGNYVVSFRNLDALVKLDYDEGEVLWQLGGVQSQFKIVGDPLGGFQGQHSVRILPDGHVLIYDNGLHHTPPESRAVEYALDTDAMTATMVWQYRHAPAIFTPFVGSVERLSNGNTLVAFGFAGVVDEVDPSGNVVWEGTLLSGGKAREAYRVRRLPSLYGYQAP